MLNLQNARTGRAKNVKNAKGMPFAMHGIFILATILSVQDQVLCMTNAFQEWPQQIIAGGEKLTNNLINDVTRLTLVVHVYLRMIKLLEITA